MENTINKLNSLKSKIKEQLKEWVKREDIPLDYRWKVFIESGLGDSDTYYHHFDGKEFEYDW